MAGQNKDNARYLVASDVHDTLRAYENSEESYFPKHSSIAELAARQGAEFIALNGDLVDEDRITQHKMRGVDERIERFIEKKLSYHDAKLSNLAMQVMYMGGREGIKGVEEIASHARGRRKRMLEDFIKKYKFYKQEEMADAVKKYEEAKNIIVSILEKDIDNLRQEIEVYYRENYIPALREAYSCFSGRILVTQGNHDPDVLRELDGLDNFIFIDQLDRPYSHGPLNIAAASNIEKYNLFPKTANFEMPKLYENCEFDIFQSDVAMEMKKFEEENLDKLKNLSREEIYEMMYEKENEIMSSSKVKKRLENSEFEDVNTVFSHAGVKVGNWDFLRKHVKKEKHNDKKPILDKNGNFQFDDSLGDSGAGLDDFVNKQVAGNKLKFLFGGHIHEKLSPSNIRLQSREGGEKNFVAGRTDEDSVFFIDTEKNSDEFDTKYREFSFEQDKKKAA